MELETEINEHVLGLNNCATCKKYLKYFRTYNAIQRVWKQVGITAIQNTMKTRHSKVLDGFYEHIDFHFKEEGEKEDA